jgi:hypothetical protein
MLYPLRQFGTLGTLDPMLHRLIGFEAENRDPFVLQAGNRAKYLGADKSRKLPGGVGNGRLRLAIVRDLVREYPDETLSRSRAAEFCIHAIQLIQQSLP